MRHTPVNPNLKKWGVKNVQGQCGATGSPNRSWYLPLMALFCSSSFLLSGFKSLKSTVFTQFPAWLPGLKAVGLWSAHSLPKAWPGRTGKLRSYIDKVKAVLRSLYLGWAGVVRPEPLTGLLWSDCYQPLEHAKVSFLNDKVRQYFCFPQMKRGVQLLAFGLLPTDS